jgi:septum formation protein
MHGREGTVTSRAMLFPNLQGWKIVLGSGSPRRRELVADLDLPVEVRVREIEEVWPDSVAGVEVAEWLAREKAAAQTHLLLPHELLITGDTVVVLGDQLLEKPADASEAFEMLRALSGRTHTVASGLAVTTLDGGTWSCLDEAQVTFADLPDSAIHHYIERYKPFDKAGAYGIQEWIGAIGVSRIEGSFYTIMGLPVHRLFEHLRGL